MQARYELTTACECQALLGATLNEQRLVVSGWAAPSGASSNSLEDRISAPANSIGQDSERFDVSWLCPLCSRNTLRTFHVGALRPLPSVE